MANNDGIYDAAINGFCAGVYLARDARGVKLAAAQTLAEQAALFAEAVDGAIAPGSPYQEQIDLVQELCQSITGNKYVTGLPSSAFDEIAHSVATLYQAISEVLIPITPTSSGTTSTLIFRPGGVTEGNVYTTSAEIATALAAVNGAAFVYLDDTLGDCIIEPGVHWDFAGFGSVFSTSAAFVQLEIKDTGKILRPGIISSGVSLLCDSQTEPSIDFTDWSQGPTILLNYSEVALSATATAAPIQIPAGMGLSMLIEEATIFSNSAAPTVPIVSIGTGGILVTVTSTLLSAATEIFPAKFAVGDESTTWSFFGDGSAFPYPDFFSGGFVGSFSYQLTTPIIIANQSGLAPNEPSWQIFGDPAEDGSGAVSVLVNVSDTPGGADGSLGQTGINLNIPIVPTRLTSTQGGPVLAAAQGVQAITICEIDTSSGAPTGPYLLPGSEQNAQDGMIFYIKDPQGTWNVNAPAFAPFDGATPIEDPNNPGTYSLAVSAPPYPNAIFGWYFSLTGNDGDPVWFLVPNSIPLSGATGARPTNPGIGFQWFDTTLDLPIWWDGTQWENAAGVPV